MLSINNNKVSGSLSALLPFMLLAFLPLKVSAQVGEYRTDLAIGVNGGYLMNKIAFVPEVPQLWAGGMTAGITVRYTCEKYFKSICAVVAEVNLAQMGWKENILDMNDEPVYYYDDEEMTDPLRYHRKMTYIQIPVMARLGWGRERRGLQGFFQIGPQIGIFRSESTDTNIEEGKSTQNYRSSPVVAQESMPVEKKFDYGVVVGAGIELSLPKVGHFLLEGRYYYGLGNIYGNTKQDYFARSNHGAIYIKATYLFDIIRTKNDKIK